MQDTPRHPRRRRESGGSEGEEGETCLSPEPQSANWRVRSAVVAIGALSDPPVRRYAVVVKADVHAAASKGDDDANVTWPLHPGQLRKRPLLLVQPLAVLNLRHC